MIRVEKMINCNDPAKKKINDCIAIFINFIIGNIQKHFITYRRFKRKLPGGNYNFDLPWTYEAKRQTTTKVNCTRFTAISIFQIRKKRDVTFVTGSLTFVSLSTGTLRYPALYTTHTTKCPDVVTSGESKNTLGQLLLGEDSGIRYE